MSKSGVLTPQEDLETGLYRLIKAGCTTIHLDPGTYPKPQKAIFLEADDLEIIGHNAVIPFDRYTAHAMIYNLCRRLTIQGLTIDWQRPRWREYSKLILLDAPQAHADAAGWKGAITARRTHFALLNNTFLDSAGGRKGAGDADNWITVMKSDHSLHNLIMNGNRLALWDTELTGGNFGYQSVEMDHNIIRGGRTTGGLLSMLSRYEGNEPRPFQDVKITNNVIEDLNTNGIAIGYDATVQANNPADRLWIEGNIAIMGSSPAKTCRFVNLKMDNFTGTAVVRNNHIDASRVPAAADITPTDIRASNRGAKGGSLLYRPSSRSVPAGSKWLFSQDIKTNEFESVFGLT